MPSIHPRAKPLAGLAAALGLLAACSNAPSDTSAEGTAVTQERFAPCSDRPNCVSSQAPPADQRHHIPPLTFTGPPTAAWERLKAAIAAMDRSRIIVEEDTYLRAEYRSAVFGFVDDLEAHLEAEQGQIQLKSASRVGYYDWGVNRDRVEALRRRFQGEVL